MKAIHVYQTKCDGSPALWLEQTAEGDLYLCDGNVRVIMGSRAYADEVAKTWVQDFSQN